MEQCKEMALSNERNKTLKEVYSNAFLKGVSVNDAIVSGATYEWKLSNGRMVDGCAMKVGPKSKANT
ncbi:MAG TPA: hypothetical protein VNS50_02915 [Ginsengibacter sp.]|nr:hypothetical protein [Ginsengibacter sp.]